MGVKSDLAQFYSKNAAHYHQTRQKFWVDGDKIIEKIRESEGFRAWMWELKIFGLFKKSL